MSEPLKLTDPVENHRLKEKDENQLLELVLKGHNWTSEESGLITSAYQFARTLHENDLYKSQPYIRHPMRVAARITAYMNIYDAEIVSAAILHDVVGDHAVELAGAGIGDVHARKKVALKQIRLLFTPRTSAMVEAVTNEPSPLKEASEDKSLTRYLTEVQEATSTPEGWIIKFSDWCENGVGIIHGVGELSADEIDFFQRKYGGEVLETYERRFREPDIQSALDWAAKGYIEYQLEQGKQRLRLTHHQG